MVYQLYKEVKTTLKMNEDDTICLKACIDALVDSGGIVDIGLNEDQVKKIVELKAGLESIGVVLERGPVKSLDKPEKKTVSGETVYMVVEEAESGEKFRMKAGFEVPSGFIELPVNTYCDEYGFLASEFNTLPIIDVAETVLSEIPAAVDMAKKYMLIAEPGSEKYYRHPRDSAVLPGVFTQVLAADDENGLMECHWNQPIWGEDITESDIEGF